MGVCNCNSIFGRLGKECNYFYSTCESWLWVSFVCQLGQYPDELWRISLILHWFAIFLSHKQKHNHIDWTLDHEDLQELKSSWLWVSFACQLEQYPDELWRISISLVLHWFKLMVCPLPIPQTEAQSHSLNFGSSGLTGSKKDFRNCVVRPTEHFQISWV